MALSKGRVVCNETDCKLVKMSCEGNKEIVPFRRFKRKKNTRKSKKVFKGAGRKKKRSSRKNKVTGRGRRKGSRRKRGKK